MDLNLTDISASILSMHLFMCPIYLSRWTLLACYVIIHCIPRLNDIYSCFYIVKWCLHMNLTLSWLCGWVYRPCPQGLPSVTSAESKQAEESSPVSFIRPCTDPALWIRSGLDNVQQVLVLLWSFSGARDWTWVCTVVVGVYAHPCTSVLHPNPFLTFVEDFKN